MSNASSSLSSLVPPSWLSGGTAHVPLASYFSPSSASTVQISRDEYDRLCQLEFSQIGHSSTHTSSSAMNAYIVSPHRPWILDLGASSHMTGIEDKFSSCICRCHVFESVPYFSPQGRVTASEYVPLSPFVTFKVLNIGYRNRIG